SEIKLGLGFTWHKPQAFQEIDGRRRDVSAAFTLHAGNSVGLTLGTYDRTRPLTIDPVVTYASYIGTNCSDEVAGVALDPQGGMYVATFSLPSLAMAIGISQPLPPKLAIQTEQLV